MIASKSLVFCGIFELNQILKNAGLPASAMNPPYDHLVTTWARMWENRITVHVAVGKRGPGAGGPNGF